MSTSTTSVPSRPAAGVLEIGHLTLVLLLVLLEHGHLPHALARRVGVERREPSVQPADHQVHDLEDLGLLQLVEHDDVVDAVQELGPEVLLEFLADLRLHPVAQDLRSEPHATQVVAIDLLGKRLLDDRLREGELREIVHRGRTLAEDAANTATVMGFREGDIVSATAGSKSGADGVYAFLVFAVLQRLQAEGIV